MRQPGGDSQGRVAGIDLARALAIVFMILSHTQLCFRSKVYGDSETGVYATFFDRFADMFLASDMAAPMFMFAMGMCMLYSRRSGVRDMAVRGGKLLMQAVFLSVVIKSGLIALARCLMISPEAVKKDSLVSSLMFNGDILDFAGLAFLVFALMKWLRFGHRAMLVLTGVLYAGYQVLLVTVGSEFLPWPFYAVLGWICGTDPMSFFPLFAWLVYPVAGYIMADALEKSADPGRLLRRAGIIGIVLFATMFAISWSPVFVDFPLMRSYEGGLEAAFYHQHPVFMLRCLGLVFAELWLAELLARRLPETLMSHCRRWSRNVNAMYILSWTLILITAGFILRERGDLSLAAWVASAVLVFALTDLGVTIWKRFVAGRAG